MLYMVLDTETAPLFAAPYPCAKYSRVYDIGWAICDSANGNIVSQKSFLLSEIYDDDYLMINAYYRDKKVLYDAMLLSGDIHAKSIRDAWAIFKNELAQYNVQRIWAYNARFDVTALNATIIDDSNGYIETWIPEGITVSDIWDYAGSTICNSKNYVVWALANNYLTEKRNPSTSAETVYRYITRDKTFQEQHTALSDALIEAEILQTAKRKHKRARNTCGQGWRDAAIILKGLRE